MLEIMTQQADHFRWPLTKEEAHNALEFIVGWLSLCKLGTSTM